MKKKKENKRKNNKINGAVFNMIDYLKIECKKYQQQKHKKIIFRTLGFNKFLNTEADSRSGGWYKRKHFNSRRKRTKHSNK